MEPPSDPRLTGRCGDVEVTPLATADARALQAIASDDPYDSTHRQIDRLKPVFDAPGTEDEWVRRAATDSLWPDFERDDWCLTWTVFLGGEVVGICHASYRTFGRPGPELAIYIERSKRSDGSVGSIHRHAGRRAAAAVIAILFAITDYPAVCATVASNNTAARLVLEHLGFTEYCIDGCPQGLRLTRDAWRIGGFSEPGNSRG